MSSRQITPRPVAPPASYSNQIATETDKADAKGFVAAVPIKTIGIVFAIAILVIIGRVWPSMQKSESDSLNVLVLVIVGFAIVRWLVREMAFAHYLQRIVSSRLAREHQALEHGEAQTTSILTTTVERIYSEQLTNVATLNDLLRETSVALSDAETFFKERRL